MNPLNPVTVCYFKGAAGRFRPDPPPPGDDPKPREYPPLTKRERLVYSLFAGWGCLTFLLLALVIILAHSPLVAN